MTPGILKARLTGLGTLLMHNVRMADPLDEFTLRGRELMLAKKKKGADTAKITAELMRNEWEGGLYHDDHMGPYIPAESIRACLIEGARASRKGVDVQRAVIAVDNARLEYDGPRDVKGMWSARMFDRRMVTIERKRVLRCRPKFRDWSCVVNIQYVAEFMTHDTLFGYLCDAGLLAGLGDARSIGLGRFEVKEIK